MEAMKKVRKIAQQPARKDAPVGKEISDKDLEKATGGYWDDYGGYSDYGYSDYGYSSGWGGSMGATYFVGGGCDSSW